MLDYDVAERYHLDDCSIAGGAMLEVTKIPGEIPGEIGLVFGDDMFQRSSQKRHL